MVVRQLVYGSNILSILAVGLSRGALMYFSLRLTPVKKQKLYLQALLGCNVAWTVASTFAVALTCDLTRPWVLAGQSCPGFVRLPTGSDCGGIPTDSEQFLRWEVVDILGCALEVALFCSAVWLTWELQVSREKKGSVLLAFGCRLG